MLAPEKPERVAAHMRAFASASQDEPPCRTPAALVSTPSGNGDGGRMMLGSGRGPERRTTPARLSPDVVGQPARHRRDSWESSPARFDCPDGRASHGSTGVARAADSLGLRGPGGVPNPRGTSGIQRDRARPHQIGSFRFAGLSWAIPAEPRLSENRGVPGSSPGLAIAKSLQGGGFAKRPRRTPDQPSHSCGPFRAFSAPWTGMCGCRDVLGDAAEAAVRRPRVNGARPHGQPRRGPYATLFCSLSRPVEIWAGGAGWRAGHA